MSLGVLIVGLGQIGMGYDLDLDPATHVYSHARAFSLHPAFHLLGGVDPNDHQRQIFEHEYRSPAFADVETALGCVQPELVVIGVPTSLHGEILHRVLKQSQPMAVLCEKPLSYDIEEAGAMVQACNDKRVRLFINYMRRSDPGVVEIKRRLEAGEIGVPVKGVAWYSKGFLHNGSHFFNLLAYWLGDMVHAQILDVGRVCKENDPEPDVWVRFERGTIVFLAASEEHYSHYTVELVAPNGRLRYERGGKQIDWQPAKPDMKLAGYTFLSDQVETIETGMSRYQQYVADELAKALDGQNFHLCNGVEALRTLEHIKTIIDKR